MIVMSRWDAFQLMAADAIGFRFKNSVAVKYDDGYRTE